MKLFGTDGIRGRHGTHPITENFAEKIGRATASSFPRSSKIIVCRDTRRSGKSLEKKLVKGIKDSGGLPALIGILPSNAVSFAIQKEKARAGIMISASHNPFQENGFKFFNGQGFKFSEEQERKMEKVLRSGKFREARQPKENNLRPYKPYEIFLERSCPSQNLKGLKVLIDAGNGSASAIAPRVFRKLKAKVAVISNKPDGLNINKNCGSTKPGNVQRKAKKFDAGIAFDGDADRLVIADEKGNLVEGDKIIGMISAYLKKQNRLKKNAAVLNGYSNKGLQTYLREKKIRTSKVKVGDKFVSKKLFEEKLSVGGEPSGHVIISELSKTSDAMLTAITVLGIMKKEGKKMSEMTSEIRLLPQIMANLDVREKKHLKKLKKLNSAVRRAEKELKGKGRIFIRYSGTEDKMRILVEGEKESKIKKLADSIVDAARSEIGK